MEQELNKILKSQEKAIDYMREVLIFLKMHFWIYNGHMTQVFSDLNSPLFQIPSEWHEHLLNLSPNEVNEVPFGFLKMEWPESLKDFVTSALCLGRLRFLPHCPENYRNQCERPLPSSLIKGMNPKKLQEVEGMARLVASICSKNGSSFVLDIGAGIGYLDQVLHYRYGLTVIGVDTFFTDGAQDRIASSSGHYCSINVSHISFTLEPTNESMVKLQELLNNIKQPMSCSCQRELSDSQNIEKSWVVVALHACGDLTRSAFQFYEFSSAVSSLVCLSCCYHKMKPGYFPMSSYLQECVQDSCEEHIKTSPVLGVYGLRLASQETRAKWSSVTHEEHLERTDHTFFRATIEHALNIRGIKWRRPQRRIAKSAYKDFQTYSQAALIGYDDSVKLESMKSYARFESYKGLLGQLNLLQILLQPVLESLILLDRACYMNFDQDKENIVWLEAVAEESLSPRNVAIISIKK